MYFKKINNSIQFRNDYRTLLHAQQKDGLYMLKTINQRNPDLALFSAKPIEKMTSTTLTMPTVAMYSKSRNFSEESSDGDPDESETDEASKSQRKRYRLMHRRFGHYGSEALRHLHEVASGIRKIHVPPKEKRVCKSCKIGKMRRKISKILEKHQESPLALISIDIAGPFVKSIRGFEYFLQIIVTGCACH
ncbi:hypothetical protein K3495_g15761 [Podosphaera aphanis]|nr:hypothetical protein K3495_g15761 [Podosphaera aphanis]